MTKLLPVACLSLLLAFASGIARAAEPATPPDDTLPPPAELAAKAFQFEAKIAAFEAADKVKPPAAGTIEFIGSSTFTRWGSVVKDMAPLPVFNRAFGGSRVADVLKVVPRIVIPYRPKVIVYYCGDNNMTDPAKADPQVPVQGFSDFLAAVRAELPTVRVVYLGIKPSMARWASWPKVQIANAALKERCAGDPLLSYVDSSAALLGADGQPKVELYAKDRLHPNAEGYAALTAVLKPAVAAAWQAAGGTAAP